MNISVWCAGSKPLTLGKVLQILVLNVVLGKLG